MITLLNQIRFINNMSLIFSLLDIEKLTISQIILSTLIAIAITTIIIISIEYLSNK